VRFTESLLNRNFQRRDSGDMLDGFFPGIADLEGGTGHTTRKQKQQTVIVGRYDFNT
jgi:hypothetical protein